MGVLRKHHEEEDFLEASGERESDQNSENDKKNDDEKVKVIRKKKVQVFRIHNIPG